MATGVNLGLFGGPEDERKGTRKIIPALCLTIVKARDILNMACEDVRMDTTKLEAEFLDDLRRFAREAIRLAKENITLRGRIDISYPTRDEGESPESWANRLGESPSRMVNRFG